MRWEAYVHTNGQIQLKRYDPPSMCLSEEDLQSPFVAKYLGWLPCDSREQARLSFKTFHENNTVGFMHPPEYYHEIEIEIQKESLKSLVPPEQIIQVL